MKEVRETEGITLPIHRVSIGLGAGEEAPVPRPPS